ncbi:hypothetical protein ACLB1M_28670 [Escherichia coli]
MKLRVRTRGYADDAMMMEFPDDPACDYLDRQYMLGDNVMVAPVFTEAGDVQFYLPEGRWTHLWHNDELDGSRLA